MDARSYTIRLLIDGKLPTEPTSWEDRGHTITIITPSSGPDDSRDDLFIDHIHIHPKKWQWIHKRRQLVWVQGSGSDFCGGHVGFSNDAIEGSGGLQIGTNNQLETVRLSYMHPSYSCDLSTDAGAYVDTDGLTLKWDTSSDKWQNATWSNNAMTFTYWVEKDGLDVGNKPLYQTATVFKETEGNTSWDVLPRGPGGATTTVSPSKELTFVLNDTYDPPLKTFPHKMAFQFTELTQNIEGGAMLCEEKSVNGKVYAMKGKSDNTFAVGSYHLVDNFAVGSYSFADKFEVGSSDEFSGSSKLDTHGGKLTVNGKAFNNIMDVWKQATMGKSFTRACYSLRIASLWICGVLPRWNADHQFLIRLRRLSTSCCRRGVI